MKQHLINSLHWLNIERCFCNGLKELTDKYYSHLHWHITNRGKHCPHFKK